jgi:hypothetical protein
MSKDVTEHLVALALQKMKRQAKQILLKDYPQDFSLRFNPKLKYLLNPE